jgi:putative flavoprotein involved in K+ transport
MSIDHSFQTIVIGGGQAGLAAGYFLAQRGDRYTILDQYLRTGDSWRTRWDSLHLFTPSKYDGLPGMAFPKPDFYFPTKDEVADYLEAYAGKFSLPVQHNLKVSALTRYDDGYRLSTSTGSLDARNVIVATGPYQKPHTPAFTQELDPAILQVHSSAYCNPRQIPVQNVLVVGAGNSGAEIALELSRAGKRVWLAGRDVGRIPADKVGRVLGGRPYWWFISRVLSVKTPMGRKMRSKVLFHGAPLINVSRQEVREAGIESIGRVSGVLSGKPMVEDGLSLPAEAVIWATGYRPDYKWIDLPVFGEDGYPRHQRGVIPEAPGLYFAGLPFQTALSSALLGGVGAEARYIVQNMGRS